MLSPTLAMIFCDQRSLLANIIKTTSSKNLKIGDIIQKYLNNLT